ncbi:MAG: PSD1 and planctomycete cytochrome C domain-containing protein [Acidobacteriota bacterium]
MNRQKIILALLGLACLSFFQGAESGSSRQVNFSQDIQPILEKSCYSCHGPAMQMAELRLDSRDRVLTGGASGKIIQPGSARESLLYQRVTGLNGLTRMPMGGDPLSEEQLVLIRAWIDQGADWPEKASGQSAEVQKHWAFVKPERPSLPPAHDSNWPSNPIDRFVLARLEKEGLSPSPQASREKLLRRLSLDLIGLPPTIAEIEGFVADTSPAADEKQVERLLASPHYGERWGRLWLDAARYADSDGFEKDKSRQVWFYRDWVIKALNRDLPYDQFIIEQIGGDLLPDPTQDQMVATGFLRNSMINEEGGIDPEQFRMEAMFDRMDAIGKGVLGLTIQCAQCHSHKFDPIKHEEYYGMFAFLNSCHEGSIAVYTPEEQMQRTDIIWRIRGIEAEVRQANPHWRERMAQWEEEVQAGQPKWTVIQPEVEDISTGGQKYLALEDGSFLAQGYAPTKHRVKMSIRTDLRKITAFRLELLNDPNLPLGGPGRSIYGTGALTEFEVEASPADASQEASKIVISSATADISLPETPLEPIFQDKSDKQRVTGPVEFAIDGKEETAWGIDAGPGRRNEPRKAVFNAETPISHPEGTLLTFYLSQKHGGWNSDDNQNNNLGRFRLSITADANAAADPLPMTVREILSIPADQRAPQQVATVFSYWRTTVPNQSRDRKRAAPWLEANARIEKLWQQHPEGSSQLVLQAREDPRPTHVLERGDFLRPLQEVSPGVPAFLHPLPEHAPPNRLTFARWLVDEESPTTARSIVNRIWQAYFGTGLVSTAENFGTQSEAPSHPELLDWLAVEFMERGWSLKELHRLIVSSSTYRQSSGVTPELLKRDPDNRLLARGARFRVDAESVRDIALAASGLLNPQVGGPSVYPPAPEFLFKPPVSYGPKVWDEETGEDRYRRAIYTFRYRSVPYPALEVFDAPKGEVSCVRRDRSNTPLQALTALNEPLFMECARALGQRALEEGGETDAQRLNYAFRSVLTRQPTAEESAELLGFFEKQKQRFSTELAWTAVTRVLLNLDETITKE